jgi:hypothetical protein
MDLEARRARGKMKKLAEKNVSAKNTTINFGYSHDQL